MHITNQAMAINVSSEVARLKSVLVHSWARNVVGTPRIEIRITIRRYYF